MRGITVVSLLLGSVFLGAWACSPDATDGDGDGDVDGDVDGDSDADGDVEPECPADWECCDDSECSDQIFCNGLEVCDRGECQASVPIDCDDLLDCTEDVCNEASNVCVHEPVHSECDDGDLCNGDERCDPNDEEVDARGCVLGSPLNCDDGDPCTRDYCEDNECQLGIRDSDADGFGDEDCTVCFVPSDPDSCETGDDCNDTNPDTYPGAIEICDDGDDNNCDRVRDYADPACIVPNDTCGAALELVPDVVRHASTRGTLADIESSCGASGDRDVAFYFTTSAVQDVEIHVASGGAGVTVGLTPSCGDADLDLRCTTGRVFTQIHRGLAAGTFFVVVSSTAELDFTIYLTTSDPEPRPAGDQCTSAIDVTSGGSFAGTTTGFDPDYEASCGEPTDRDATYTFTLTEASAVDISVDATSAVSVAVQESCGVASTEWGCFEGDPAEELIGSLSPGTYYVIVKSATEVDFTLDITISMTSADRCGDARDASAGGTFFGTTIDMTADIDTACGDDAGPDSVYAFTLAMERDVSVDFRSMGEAQTMSLTTICDDPDAELRCSSGESFELRGRGLGAGTYYLITTGDLGEDFEFDLTLTAPVPRPADDLCTGAIDITGGGVGIMGDTTDCENDYESRCGDATDLDTSYTFTLTEARSLDIAVTATTGPVTVAVQRACGVTATERGCFTAATTDSRHIRSLDPGTWFVIVKTPVADSFELDVTFGPPEPGVDLNFIAMPWDFFAYDAAVASVIYRAVTYDFGFDPVVGCVLDGSDTDGEFLQTKAALTSRGFPAANLIDIADAAAALAALGTYDVLLFNELEVSLPSVAAWRPVIDAHIASGGRVITANGSRNDEFINGLAIFGSGTQGSGSTPYTTEPHPFWDAATTMTTTSHSATWSWNWTGPFLTPLVRRSSAPSELMVWGYDVP